MVNDLFQRLEINRASIEFNWKCLFVRPQYVFTCVFTKLILVQDRYLNRHDVLVFIHWNLQVHRPFGLFGRTGPRWLPSFSRVGFSFLHTLLNFKLQDCITILSDMVKQVYCNNLSDFDNLSYIRCVYTGRHRDRDASVTHKNGL